MARGEEEEEEDRGRGEREDDCLRWEEERGWRVAVDNSWKQRCYRVLGNHSSLYNFENVR